MAIKRELLEVEVTFNETEIYARSAKDAVEHRLYNIDGVLEWDTHMLTSLDNDDDTATEKFLLCVVYNTYDLSGSSLEDVIDTELYTEDGVIGYATQPLKESTLDATIALEEISYGSSN
ncbi:hypothetical protein KAMFAM_162 [Bacillus phage Kamfam]|nr:hypothetical protein OTK52_160 [Bacillus phage OTooleKemple52]AXQ67176.1 hypothetical protein KAMFAM_162 [Bacillus phage Kamfam]